MTKYFAIFIFILSSFDIYASRLKERDYFASLRSDKVNVRFGPGMNYDIKYVFRLKSMPVRVIAEYENWVEIEDFEGDEGWVNKNLITKRRTAMVRTDLDYINLHKSNFAKSKIILRLENKVVIDMIKCIETWCKVKVDGKSGWVNKYEIWGWRKNEK